VGFANNQERAGARYTVARRHGAVSRARSTPACENRNRAGRRGAAHPTTTLPLV